MSDADPTAARVEVPIEDPLDTTDLPDHPMTDLVRAIRAGTGGDRTSVGRAIAEDWLEVHGMSRELLDPIRATAILPAGYRFEYLDPPGLLVLHLPEHASEEDMLAAETLVDALSDLLEPERTKAR